MTWFAVRDYFCQNICDLIYEKGSLLKHLKKQFCIHICSYHEKLCIYIYSNCVYTKLFFWDVLTVIIFDKSHFKCFDRSGLLLQISSHLYTYTLANKNNNYITLYIWKRKCMTLNIILPMHIIIQPTACHKWCQLSS